MVTRAPHGAVDRALPTARGWTARVLLALFTHRQAWVWPGPGSCSGKEVPQSRGLPCRPRLQSQAACRLEGGAPFGLQPCAQGDLHPRAGLMASTASWFDPLGLGGRGDGVDCQITTAAHHPEQNLPQRGQVPTAGPRLALLPPSPHLSLSAPLTPSCLSHTRSSQATCEPAE